MRILALEAEVASERSARATLVREHADLQAKHDLLVAEHDRLNALLKLYAS